MLSPVQRKQRRRAIWLSFAFSGAFFAHTYYLAKFIPRSETVLSHALRERRTRHPAFQFKCFIIRDKGALVSIGPDQIKARERVAQTWGSNPFRVTRVCIIHGRYSHYKAGIWAPTQKIYDHRLWVELIGSLTPAERDWARAEYVKSQQQLAAWGSTRFEPKLLSLLAQGEGVTRTTIFTGYIHNLIALITFIALIRSLRWFPELLRQPFHEIRVAQKHCPECDYDLTNNPAPGCPECGWNKGLNVPM